MQEAILFIMSFVLIFMVYQLFIIIPAKRRYNDKSNKMENKELLEIKYLVSIYHLDLDKIEYAQLLQICAITSSIDIALIVSLITLFSNFLLEIIVGFVLIIILIFISYHLVYLFYKKKGMIKDGKYK